MPVEFPGRFNQALMELGATVCLPNGAPQCARCPAAAWCRALEMEDFSFPVKPAKKARNVENRTVFLVFGVKGVALRRRPERGLLAGLWEFPNEIAPWSCPIEGKQAYLGEGKHIFTHVEWHMSAWVVTAESEVLPQGWVWADRAALRQTYPLPSAFQSFSKAVEERLLEKEREE